MEWRLCIWRDLCEFLPVYHQILLSVTALGCMVLWPKDTPVWVEDEKSGWRRGYVISQEDTEVNVQIGQVG